MATRGSKSKVSNKTESEAASLLKAELTLRNSTSIVSIIYYWSNSQTPSPFDSRGENIDFTFKWEV